MSRARKGRTDPDFPAGRVAVLAIHDDGWAKIVAHLPTKLDPGDDARLRAQIGVCCSQFRSRHKKLLLDVASAAVMRRPKRGRLAPFERFTHGLKMAGEARLAIDRVGEFHGSRLVDESVYAPLENMARVAAAQLARLRRLTPTRIDDPFELLVWDVADVLDKAGFPPTISGKAYDPARSSLTWFMEFVTQIDLELLASRGLFHLDSKTGKEHRRDRKSTYNAIVKAFRRRGGGKPAHRRK